MIETMANVFLPSCSSIQIMDESVETRNIFYRLGESELFNYANQATLIGNLHLVDVVPRMVVKDHGFLQLDFSRFDKNLIYELFDSGRFKMSCKKQLRNLLETEKIILVYSEEYKVPTSIPYIAQTQQKQTIIYANVSDFVEVDDFGVVKVTTVRNYNALMSIIFASAISYELINRNTSASTTLIDGMVLSYAAMLEGVINAIVHLDPIARDKVRYLSSKFALVQMYGTVDGLNKFERIKSKYFPKLTKIIIDTMDNQFKEDNFDKLSLFIDELKRLYPSMKILNEYTVYDKWIRRYGSATAMGIDYFGYHIYTICMVIMESPLITRMALEPIMEKSRGTSMYEQMQHILSNR